MRDRIVRLDRVKASELRQNPNNWRLHPHHQKAALQSLLDRIGMVDAVIARETPDGLQLVDGHLRTELADDDIIPVLVVDLNDKEANQVLATFDPVGDLAKTDDDMFAVLAPDLEDLQDDAELRRLLGEIHQQFEEDEKEDKLPEHSVEGMDLEPHEHYDQVLVLASTTHEWNVLCTRLGLEPVQRRNRSGVQRAIPARRLLALLEAAEGGES